MAKATARLKSITIPPDAKKALGKALLKTFTAMSPSHQKEWINALNSAKKPQTRARRLEFLIKAMQEKAPR